MLFLLKFWNFSVALATGGWGYLKEEGPLPPPFHSTPSPVQSSGEKVTQDVGKHVDAGEQ